MIRLVTFTHEFIHKFEENSLQAVEREYVVLVLFFRSTAWSEISLFDHSAVSERENVALVREFGFWGSITWPRGRFYLTPLNCDLKAFIIPVDTFILYCNPRISLFFDTTLIKRTF